MTPAVHCSKGHSLSSVYDTDAGAVFHLPTVQEWETDQKVTATGTITDVGEVLGYTVRVESLD